MAKRKRYTDEFRASAVLMWEANPNYVQVAKHLNMPEATLRSWVNQAGLNGNGKQPANSALDAEIYDAKKIDFEKSVTELLGLHFDHAKHTIEGADHHQIIGGIKVLFDVRQLLTGGATSNENRRIVVHYAE